MTKKQELEILAEAVAKLGPDSYLGPWLGSITHEVERCIRSDIFPQISLVDAQQECRQSIAAAKKVLADAYVSQNAIINAGHETARRNANAAKIDVNTALQAAIEVLQDRKYHRS